MEDIKKDLEARKFKLVNMLKFESENIALERQHQIYGAIKELDMVIGLVMDYSKIKTNDIELKSVNRDELMNKISKKLR
jgi:hypothetical protein